MIITRGYGSKLVVTRGYGEGVATVDGGSKTGIESYLTAKRLRRMKEDEEILIIIMAAVDLL